MIKGTTRKTVAILLVLLHLQSLVWINDAKADTGILEPEQASFESSSAADMVQLSSGDFTYNIPIMNIGDYPLSLSYHAGIPVNMESSWTGLGWNINPGSINRTVNGLPDDYSAAATSIVSHFQSNAHKSESVSVGVGYKGFQVGFTHTWGTEKGVHNTMRIGAFGSYIDTDKNYGIGFSAKGMQLQLTNTADLSMSAGPLTVGYNLNTKSSNTSIGVGNFHFSDSRMSQLSNSQMGYHASGSQVTGMFNIYGVSVSVGYGKREYTYSQHSSTKRFSFGSLYTKRLHDDITNSMKSSEQVEGDFSILAEEDQNVFKTEKSTNFAYMTYDAYSVTGEGLGGFIAPRIYENTSLYNNSYTYDYDEFTESYVLGEAQKIFEAENTIYYHLNNPLSKGHNNLHFYFLGSPGGNIKVDENTFSLAGSSFYDGLNDDGGALNIHSDFASTYNSTKMMAAKGNYIKWYTNLELGRNPEEFPIHGIGGYSITKMDGMTYHYKLPVYNFEEFHLQFNDYGNFHIDGQDQAYAYTWLLTAITGPDYVDNGNSGIGDEDYGYWVKFNYGKWTDGYIWKLPYEGYQGYEEVVLEGITYKKTSVGRKQIYYLNTIETKSQVAYFEKSLREDGLGYPDFSWNKNLPAYVVDTRFKDGYDQDEQKLLEVTGHSTINFNASTSAGGVQKLKLDKIYLFNKDIDLSSITTSTEQLIVNEQQGTRSFATNEITGTYYYKKESNGIYTTTEKIALEDPNLLNKLNGDFNLIKGPLSFSLYYPGNVLDEYSIPEDLKQKALRTIEFEYDYSLVRNVPNNSERDIPENVNKGRLTLLSVKQYGKNQSSTTPPYTFEYYDDHRYPYNILNIDDWGYYAELSIHGAIHSDLISGKNLAHLSSLKTIHTPIGSKLEIQYESDRYMREGLLGDKAIFRIYKQSDPDYWIDHSEIIAMETGGYARTIHLERNIQGLNVGDKIYITGRMLGKRTLTTTSLLGGDQTVESIETKPYSFTTEILAIGYDQSGNKNITLDLTDLILEEKAIFEDVEEIENDLISGDPIPPILSGLYSSLVDWVQSIINNQEVESLTYETKLDIKKAYFVDDFSRIKYGGGIRVKKLILRYDNHTHYNTTTYDYSNNDGTESGVATFSPNMLSEGRHVPNGALLPAPTVVYSRVKETSTLSGQSMVYSFHVPSEGMLSNEILQDAEDISMSNTTNNGHTNNTIVSESKRITLQFGLIGSMRSVYAYDSKGYLKRKVNFDYNYTNSGLSQETFRRTTRHTWYPGYSIEDNCFNETNKYYHVSSTLKSVVPVLTKKTIKEGNNVSTEEYGNRNIFTGMPKTVISTVNGNKYKTETDFAFEITDYEGMGSKAIEENNKNMLSQVAKETSFKDVDEALDSEDWKYTGLSIQTWNDNWTYPSTSGDTEVPVWRKHKTFVFDGERDTDGFLIYDPQVNVFNWGTNSGTDWEETGEIRKYNHYSVPLEIKDINGNFTASKVDVNNRHLIANVSGAQYYEFAANSFENVKNGDFGGGIGSNHMHMFQKTTGDNGIEAHTGTCYAEVLPADQGNEHGTYSHGLTHNTTGSSLEKGRMYRASVWVHKNSDKDAHLVMSLSDGTSTVEWKNMDIESSNVQVGEWKLLNVDIEIPNDANDYTLSTYVWNNKSNVAADGFNSVFIDDFRVYPVDAAISTYTFTEDGQVSSISGNENFATFYTYDEFGRLKEIWQETAKYGKKKVSKSFINYKRNNEQNSN